MAAQIELLDCTLRDGGHVNNWQFGHDKISRIIKNLNRARVDFIEMGFLRDTDYSSDRSLFSSIEQANEFLEDEKVTSNFTLMIRPDWINFKSSSECSIFFKIISLNSCKSISEYLIITSSIMLCFFN